MARREEGGSVNDPGWAHLTLVDAKKRKVQCNYCGKILHGGITRGKQHLAGVRGETKQCDVAPRPVREEMRQCLLGIKDKAERRAEQRDEIVEELSGRIRRDDDDEAGFEDSDPDLTEELERARGKAPATSGPKTRSKSNIGSVGNVGPMDSYVHRRETSKQPKIKQALRGVKKSAESAGHAFKSICKWFFHAGVPAHAAESEYFQPMIDAVADAGTGFKAPSRRDIYGRGLEGEVEELHEWVESFKPIWFQRGCTIMCDGWTGTTKKSMINFLVYCVEGTVFVKSVDASNYEKNAKFLFHLMNDMVAEVGEENVVQVITDNEPSYKAAGKLLMEKRTHLYWLPCAAHCLDLILEDIGKDHNVKQTIEQTQQITRYIYGHPRILNMFRELASGGRDIIRAGPTRFASNFISLESLHKFKNELKSFLYHNTLREYIDKCNADGQMDYLECCHIVENKKFWVRVARYLKIVLPLVKVLKMVDGDDKNDMGYLYEAMDRAKLELQQSLPTDYHKWWKIIDHRWDKTLHHDLHAAGYFLNPRLMYATNAMVDDGEVLQGTLNVIGRLSITAARRLEAELQMDAYRMKTGTFSDSQLHYAVGRVSPAEWWIMVNNRHMGSNALAYIAIRVLSQTTSASQCERNWSTFSLIHSKVRNRLKADRLEKLVYCHYNMRLRVKNMRLRQQLREKRDADDTTGEIDVDALFDDDNPLQSWVEIREQVDDPVFDPDDRQWAEGILDGAEPRDPEFKVPEKRQRVEPEQQWKGKQPEFVPDTEEQPEFEPPRYSESDSRPVTPRMVKPPPSLRRTTSVHGMTERTSEAARNDPAIQQLKNIYVRNTPRGKGLQSKMKDAQKKESKARRRLVSYCSDDEDDDDDDDDGASDDPSTAAGATAGGGIYAPTSSFHGDAGRGHGHSEGGYDSQSQYGYGAGYGGGKQQAGMQDWGHEADFAFYPHPGSSGYGSTSHADSGHQSNPQPYTPRGIQRGMQDLATSLFGYSEYAQFMPQDYQQHKPDDEGEGSSSFYPY